jgi:HEAT repeat protein
MTLAEKRDERSAQSILGAIQGAEFQRRDLRERESFFEALGRSGSDSLIPKLEGMLTKGGLFGGGNDDERYHAALALAWLGTPKALALLDRELKNKRDGIRSAVERALTTVRQAALATQGGDPSAAAVAVGATDEEDAS